MPAEKDKYNNISIGLNHEQTQSEGSKSAGILGMLYHLIYFLYSPNKHSLI